MSLHLYKSNIFLNKASAIKVVLAMRDKTLSYKDCVFIILSMDILLIKNY